MADAAVQMTDSSSTLTVQTSRFGEVTIDAGKVIRMTSPFLGFPDSRRFFLKAHSKDSPFFWLQSVDEPELAFVVVQAQHLLSDYHPSLPPFVLKELGHPRESELDILLLLTIPKGHPERMTANLLAPLVVNSSRRLAKQVLLDPHTYDPCWPVFNRS